MERQRPRRLRHARAVRGLGAEHADLRGEPAGDVQGHRHHAGGPQLRPMPALRRAHVPRRREEAGKGALADDGHPGNLTPEDAGCRWGAAPRLPRKRGPMTSVAQAGERIEELLAALRARGGAAADTAEELVRLLVGMYGDGLAAIMAALAEEGEAGRAIAARLT